MKEDVQLKTRTSIWQAINGIEGLLQSGSSTLEAVMDTQQPLLRPPTTLFSGLENEDSQGNSKEAETYHGPSGKKYTKVAVKTTLQEGETLYQYLE